jgi:hypothetical protein
MDPKILFERIVAIGQVCVEWPMAERLLVLESTWLVLAEQARAAALYAPGGFPDERARQVALLREMIEKVEAATPDLDGAVRDAEIERLWVEGDFEGVAREIRRRLDPPPDPSTDPDSL